MRYISKKISSMINIIIISCTIYFLCSGIMGDKGLITMISLLNNKNIKEHEYEALESKKNLLNNKVQGLKDDSIDLDLLDERVRDNLGYVGKDELVMHYNK